MLYPGCTQVYAAGMDQNLIHGVAEAAFANPFSPRRAELDAALAAMPTDSERDAVVDAVVDRIGSALLREPELDVRHVPQRDRRALELTLLFHTFHRHANAFDDLIERQIAAGPKVVAAKFGSELIAWLVQRGFHATRAERMLSVLYQVRRAFYFVSRSLTGTSDCMSRLRARVWQNIFTDDIMLYEQRLWSRMEDFSTFLWGETGTGKGTAAAAIGRSGWIPWDGRAKRFAHGFDDGFLSINLSQFPESLIESELFGHARGAFTGAVEDHVGVFARCREHGTIFLDEIGEVATPIQIKLLRVLQERVFTPVGSHTEVPFRGRIVAATLQPPAALRARGAMRDDFYYRLCSDVVEVPPLRKRLAEDPNELDALVTRILQRTLQESDDALSSSIVDVIRASVGEGYHWPGNVRELEQCVRRVLITRSYTPESATTDQLGDALGRTRITSQELVSRYCAALYAQIGSYEGVGRVVDLDRRTVKRHVSAATASGSTDHDEGKQRD